MVLRATVTEGLGCRNTRVDLVFLLQEKVRPMIATGESIQLLQLCIQGAKE
jgi:hypothetical protein